MIIRIILTVSLTCLAVGIVPGQTVVHPWGVVDQGGGRTSAGGVSLQTSVGQTAVVSGSSGTINLEAGYMPGLRRLAGTAFSMEYVTHGGWNMVSVPLIVSDYTKTTLYPGALSSAFSYNAGYVSTDTLSNSVGYWMKFDTAVTVPFQGTAITEDSAGVNQGWNIVGGLSYPLLAGQITGVPPVTVLTQYYGYTDTTGYFGADTLYPGHAYWVKVSHAGKLVLRTGSLLLEPGSPPMLSQKKRDAGGTLFSSGKWHSLTVGDGSGQKRLLYYTSAAGTELSSYEMPPLPPSGLDVRYGSNRSVETPEGERTKPIRISGATYPVTIRWEAGEEATLVIDGKETAITGTGEIRLEKAAADISLRILSGSMEELPKEFSLGQNYPNPFNPTTRIEYALPVSGHVHMTVYNMLGQRMMTVIDDVQEAGYRSVTFDARELPSGIYFYRITAGTFADVKRMIFIK